jgi:hypothetical protein
METRILAENIINSIIQNNPAVGELLERTGSYEHITNSIKDLLDQESQLKTLLN